MPMHCCANSPLDDLAASLGLGLRLELRLTPKPGLVDRWSNGAHPDLDFAIMSRSIELLEAYFFRCVLALRDGQPLERLRELGRDTERRLWSAFGTNTHRGAVFLGALLIAGAHRAGEVEEPALRTATADAARELFAAGLPRATTGSAVRARYRVGGIVDEAQNGLPSMFETALPALALGERLGLGRRYTCLLAMSRLMQAVEDTTTLRRCGKAGLRRLHADGREIEQLLLDRGDPVDYLVALDRHYRRLGMTMGGVADLLALALGWRYGFVQATVADDRGSPAPGVQPHR